MPQQHFDSITSRLPLRVGKYNEKINCVNTMAAALNFADHALTVSPSYAVECAIERVKGAELEVSFALGKVTGIPDGVKEVFRHRSRFPSRRRR